MFVNNGIKGNMTLILLSSLMDGEKYGYEITKEIARLTNDEILLKEGSLYPALHKLEKEGLTESFWQQQEPGKPGRKYYRITDNGRKTVEEERKKWSSFIGTMGRIIYGEQNS
ncbi:MAG: helix-turn-helix transcriptional regulator [Bacillota bacterium]|nr:helix-turn-helix transcriptional regulator [Bacillota bacterium]